MSIAFSFDRWEKVRKVYGEWWQGTLERSLVPVILNGRDPGRTEPKAPLLTQSTCHDLSIPASEIIDRIDYELSKQVYLGDSFPYYNFDCFGPGVVAAFLGAELDNSTGRVWFHPKEVIPISELHFEYDESNKWFNRIIDIYSEGMKRWQGQVLMGMPDLGGIMDILSTFRPADNLLYDLYDYPEEIKRLTWEIHDLWHRYYHALDQVLQPLNPGYCDWSQIYSEKPSYILQSDFSYMMGPDMFEEFVKPELEISCKKLTNTIYHLDGVGQLTHLDSLLEISELKAVQWIPGAGKPDQTEWPEVQRKIRAAGKNIQLHSGFDGLNKVIEQLGSTKGIHHMAIVKPLSEETEIRRALASYEIE